MRIKGGLTVSASCHTDRVCEREPKAFFTLKQHFISTERSVTQILHLDIYLKELKIETNRDTCMLVFIAALFIIANM